MDTDLALLHQKIDTLTATVEAQRRRLEQLDTSPNNVINVNAKLDQLLEYMADQRQRQQEWQELQNDVVPIANHVIKLSIDELAEIGNEFQLEDLLFLIKRLLRDTQLLTELVGRMEATVELADDIQTIGNQAFQQAIVALDRMERQGYFTFARGGWRIIEKIVAEFGEEDISALGDNIVLILNTIKSMTQPEIMNFVHDTLLVAETEIDKPVDISYTGILRQMRDPAVRRGLALTMRVLHVVGSQAGTNGVGNN
jgi:uncharacterized protein YjgD (DUF1641 family)